MSDAKRVTEALGGQWYGGYGMACCPAHENTRTPALKLADGEAGRLLVHCFAGCGFREVMTALEDGGLVPAFYPGRRRPRQSAPAAFPRLAADRSRDNDAWRELALSIWSEATPIAGTVAERYLRSRAIIGDLPLSLRYCRECWHPGVRRAVPTMVAAVRRGRNFVGIHRSWLSEPGRRYGTAPFRAMLGSVLGGGVHLRSVHGPLLVGEGIETMLSLEPRYICDDATVLAALSTSGVAGLELPPVPGRLIAALDGDEPGRMAAESLVARAREAGWQAAVLAPPGAGRDWNDLVMEEAGKLL